MGRWWKDVNSEFAAANPRKRTSRAIRPPSSGRRLQTQMCMKPPSTSQAEIFWRRLETYAWGTSSWSRCRSGGSRWFSNKSEAIQRNKWLLAGDQTAFQRWIAYSHRSFGKDRLGWTKARYDRQLIKCATCFHTWHQFDLKLLLCLGILFLAYE